MVSKQKILIVDDDNNIAELISLYLTKECFDTMIVNDGESVMPAMETFAPNLILLDLMLPGIDGYQVCREVRAQYSVPIIMLSAKGEVFDKVLGLELGADDYMAKPFNPLELVARVKALLRRADAQTSELRRGELLLNLSSHELWKNDRQITLTPMEYKLLSLMMKNPGRIFTKAQLYENINGEFFESDENTIMVHISKLRDKIETDPKQPVYIKTVRGVGYRFEV